MSAYLETGSKFEWSAIRLGAFIVALFLYALAGSPTPDRLGWAEMMIGLLFLLALGPGTLVRAFSIESGGPFWRLAGKMLLIFGCIVPLAAALLHGHDLIAVFRDLAAFVFLCLPVFVFDLIRKNDNGTKYFFFTLVVAGLIFSLRVLAPAYGISAPPVDLLYLANSPLVLMAAIYLAGLAGMHLYNGPMQTGKALTLAALAVIPVMAMLVDVQRATVSAIFLSLGALVIIGFAKAPKRMVFPVFLCGLLGAAVFVPLMEVLNAMALKTSHVGLNMRAQELQAVINAVSASPGTILFGLGWGAEFASPAVGGLNVTFTHSLLTYMFLKTGIFGLLLTLFYVSVIFIKAMEVLAVKPVRGLALVWPLVIPVFLYASHKSLDFGLVLVLALLWAGELQRPRRSCKELRETRVL